MSKGKKKPIDQLPHCRKFTVKNGYHLYVLHPCYKVVFIIEKKRVEILVHEFARKQDVKRHFQTIREEIDFLNEEYLSNAVFKQWVCDLKNDIITFPLFKSLNKYPLFLTSFGS